MPNPITSDELDAYVNGGLPETDAARVDRALATDPTLATELGLRADAATAARRAAVVETIRDSARAHAYRQRGGARVRTLSTRSALAAAASVLVVVVAGAFLYRGAAASTPEALAAAYFEPDPGLPTTLGEAEDAAFDEAMIDYKLGDYPAALRGWEQLRAGTGSNDTLSYFHGVTLLALERPGAAAEVLGEVGGGGFEVEARWYEALAALGQGDEGGARRLLTGVAAAGGAYAREAEALLAALD